MPQRQALLHELAPSLGIDAEPRGVGRRRGLADDLAHVVQEARDGKHDGRVALLVDVVEEILRILVPLRYSCTQSTR